MSHSEIIAYGFPLRERLRSFDGRVWLNTAHQGPLPKVAVDAAKTALTLAFAEKMKEAVWLKPHAVAQIEFLEWTGADHLLHTKFIGLRDDNDRRTVVRET